MINNISNGCIILKFKSQGRYLYIMVIYLIEIVKRVTIPKGVAIAQLI